MQSSPGGLSGKSTQPFGGYRPMKCIGRGSYGEVWLAEDAVGKRVAIKIVDRDRLGHSSRREERALRLIRHRLPDHPNLVRIEHIGLDERRIYYVMELADPAPGAALPAEAADPYAPHTLSHEIEHQGPIEAAEAIKILTDILSALVCLHSHGLVHRDVKPANVIRVGGVWKLADVGLVTAEDAQMTSVGTVEYQPQSGPLDRSVDLYAAGKVLYCLITANSARAFPVLPPSLLTRERRGTTRIANALVLRACDDKPERRFRSAEEFLNAVENAQRQLARAGSVRLSRVTASSAMLLLSVLVVGGAVFAGRPGKTDPEEAWRSLFDGETMAGWFCDRPGFHGVWSVQDGALTAERDSRYKLLTSEEEFDYGSFRAEVIPGHEGSRLGLMYGAPHGSLLMLMGDKYTWISGDKDPAIYEQPGSWRSFPGPIPPPGEPVLMQVDWGPDRCRLYINGEFMQEVPGWPQTGNLILYIWADDTGSFRKIAYRPEPARNSR